MTNEADDVSDEHTPPQLVAAETTVQTLPLEPPAHIRVGGHAGLRVQQQGAMTTVKRVTAGNDEPMGVTLPTATVAELRAVFAEKVDDAAKLAAVHALLKPYLHR